MSHYLGGCYLVKLRPLDFGTSRDEIVYTASDCINDNLINPWAYSWTKGINKETKEAIRKFGLADDTVFEIRKWIDLRHKENKIGWINVFSEIETAREYQRKFFPDVDNVELFALYFGENEANDIIEEFRPQSKDLGEIGLYQMLLKQIAEIDRPDEALMGYDLVGIEGGGDFHSFHCHDIGPELSERFGLAMNQYGLFDAKDDWSPVLEYLNSEECGCEPVPWFVAKTKLVGVD